MMKKINSQAELAERINVLEKEKRQLEKEIRSDYTDICRKATDTINDWKYGLPAKVIKGFITSGDRSSVKPWWRRILRLFK